VQPQGKIVTNKVFLVRHSNICIKQPFDNDVYFTLATSDSRIGKQDH